MKLKSLWCFLCFSVVCNFCSSITNTSSSGSRPGPGYIVAESDTGFANRLRVLGAYMWVAKWKYEESHVAFIWDVNEACPGHFLSVFKPIPSVIFASNMSRYVLDKHAKVVYENSNAVFTWTLQMNGVPKSRFGLPTWGDIENKMYSRYFPTDEIMEKVNGFVSLHDICRSSAMHIRATDMALLLSQKNKRLNVDSYIQFVESRPANESVYLLTDDPKTQKLFLEKFGDKKVLVFDRIIDPEKSSGLAQDHRYTSLEHTVIDVFIAAHAREFKGAAFSSLTELVSKFSDIGRNQRGWCP